MTEEIKMVEGIKMTIPIETKVFNKLKKLGFHISFAESCTGGLLAATMINVEGASDVIGESYVTYSNEAKTKLLGVNPDTIVKYDVVSREVANEMAFGLYQRTHAEVCISVTGYVGPGNGTSTIPVGTVWVSYYVKGALSQCRSYHYDPSHFLPILARNSIRQAVTSAIFNDLYEILKEYADVSL